MFIKVRRTFTLGSVLFLLLLFTLPSLYLKNECDGLRQLCDRVVNAEDREAYAELRDRYEAMRSKAEMFLDHKALDGATVPLRLMGVYLLEEDRTSLQAAAEEFLQALDCLQAVETGDLRLLL